MYDIHYNPNRKQQEKYKNMLKRKNKEIKRLKININTLLNIIKDMFDEEAVYNMCGLTKKEFIKYIKEELK